MANRSLTWSAALREATADRVARSSVREERLRSMFGLRSFSVLDLSAWRGRSGRRYVVVVQPLDTPDLVAVNAAVVLAVSRDSLGQASVVAARACPLSDPGFLGWLAACAGRGARELHAHRLAETEAERAVIAADLTGPVVFHTAGAA